jgi:hypothetical protein
MNMRQRRRAAHAVTLRRLVAAAGRHALQLRHPSYEVVLSSSPTVETPRARRPWSIGRERLEPLA